VNKSYKHTWVVFSIPWTNYKKGVWYKKWCGQRVERVWLSLLIYNTGQVWRYSSGSCMMSQEETELPFMMLNNW